MSAKTSLSLLAAAALSACVNLAPAHERPALPVAATVGAADAQSQDLPKWQGYYAGDARLQALIEVALRNNRDLRAALANAQQAAALARVSDANRWPTVAAGFISSRQPNSKGDAITSSYQAGLQISAYELDLWGRLKNQSEAAQARYLASAEGAKAARLALIGSVAATHYALQIDEQVLELARQTAAGRAESHRLTKLRFDNGAASSLELQGANSALEATKAALAQAERQRAQDENALVLLLGQPLAADLPVATALNSTVALAAGVRSEVLLERPDVRQAEAQLIAAEANIGAARAAFFPSILLSTSAGTASSQLSELFKQSAWSFTGQLLAPLFDAGRNRANLEGAKAARDAAIAQYDKAVQQAFREVADALIARSTLTEQLRAQSAQADAEAERLRLVELRFANGASSQLELLDAQRASFAAQQAALQVKLASLQSGVQLYRALGGGS